MHWKGFLSHPLLNVSLQSIEVDQYITIFQTLMLIHSSFKKVDRNLFMSSLDLETDPDSCVRVDTSCSARALTGLLPVFSRNFLLFLLREHRQCVIGQKPHRDAQNSLGGESSEAD